MRLTAAGQPCADSSNALVLVSLSGKPYILEICSTSLEVNLSSLTPNTLKFWKLVSLEYEAANVDLRMAMACTLVGIKSRNRFTVFSSPAIEVLLLSITTIKCFGITATSAKIFARKSCDEISSDPENHGAKPGSTFLIACRICAFNSVVPSLWDAVYQTTG